MDVGFPSSLLSAMRCTYDGGGLQLVRDCQWSDDNRTIAQGAARCVECGADFRIDEGILNLLGGHFPDDQSRREQAIRDELARRIDTAQPPSWENDHNLIERQTTLEALAADADTTMLELGCGDGRYTVLLAQVCLWVLAVDFSIESLRVLRRRLQGGWNVGLVLADVTMMKVAARQADVVFSTLTSNLPSREHRQALYRLAIWAVKPNGRFVFSVHHYGLRERWTGVEKRGCYEPGGIYRYCFTVEECREEIRPYFRSVTARPMQIYLPFARRWRVPLSRFCDRLPFVRNLGNQILCVAKRPRAAVQVPGNTTGSP